LLLVATLPLDPVDTAEEIFLLAEEVLFMLLSSSAAYLGSTLLPLM
jgi:hypothetical protein